MICRYIDDDGNVLVRFVKRDDAFRYVSVQVHHEFASTTGGVNVILFYSGRADVGVLTNCMPPLSLGSL